MEINVRPELRKFIEDQVRSGDYPDASAVVSAALQALKDQREGLEDLRREVRVGIEQADRGEFAEFTAEDIKAEGRRALAARDGKAAKGERGTSAGARGKRP